MKCSLFVIGEGEVISQIKSLEYKVFRRKLLNNCKFVGVEISHYSLSCAHVAIRCHYTIQFRQEFLYKITVDFPKTG